MKAMVLIVPHVSPTRYLDFTRWYYDSVEELVVKWSKYEQTLKQIGIKVEYIEYIGGLSNICRWDEKRDVLFVAFFDENGSIFSPMKEYK